MALPQGADINNIRVSFAEAQTEKMSMSTWGNSVTPSKGKCPLCGPCNATAPMPGAYAGKFPAGAVVSIAAVRKWRDVNYATVEVQPVSVDHSSGEAEILH